MASSSAMRMLKESAECRVPRRKHLGAQLEGLDYRAT